MNFNNRLLKILSGFTIVGIVTTIISIVLIYLFLKVLHSNLFITYTLIYAGTIFLSYFLNTIFVFKHSFAWSKAYKYGVIYVSSMIFGIGILWFFKKVLPFENYILVYLVLPFTFLWNFILSLKLFKD